MSKAVAVVLAAVLLTGVGCAEIKVESRTVTQSSPDASGTLPPTDEKNVAQIMTQGETGGWPVGSFEISHTGGHEAVRDIRIFVITDVEIDHGRRSDCLVAFWKDSARPVGFSCFPPRWSPLTQPM